jgi:tetratricopeptide (TPR) repeat protein
MFLFKRKKKKNVNPNAGRIMLTCPNCGKEHAVRYYQPKEYYLDGTPKDLEGVLSMAVICDCGCLCEENIWSWQAPSQIIAQPEYQAILQHPYNEVEKKLRLMSFFPPFYGRAEVLLTHIVPLNEQKDATLRAIERLEELEPQYPEMWLDKFIIGDYMPHFKWHGESQLGVSLQLADLYRRLGKFDNALARLQQESERWPNSQYTQEYIAFQNDLMNKKNVNIL